LYADVEEKVKERKEKWVVSFEPAYAQKPKSFVR
jgi:hypothetical protein